MTIKFPFVKFLLPLFILSLFTACKDDDPQPENEQELITTLRLTFTPTGAAPIVVTYKDTDGTGPTAPSVQPINLKANTTYNLKVEALDESKNPAVDITEEIEEEDDEHQFFFQVTGANLTVTYADMDGNGRPIGLNNTAVTTTAGSGTLKVILRHQLNKAASGVNQGNIANAGGDTDIETTPPFTVNITN